MKGKSVIIYKVELPGNYFVNVEDSVLYDYRIIAKGKCQITPIEKFITERFKQLGLKAPERLTEIKKTAVNNMICNVYNMTLQGKVVAISRNKNYYKGYRIYGMEHYTYDIIINVLDALRRTGYIRQWNGFYDKEIRKGKVSRIWAEQKLLNEIQELAKDYIEENLVDDDFENSDISNLDYGFTKIKYSTPVILKNKKKKLIEYKPTKNILQAIKFLDSYNNFVDENLISAPWVISNASPINTTYNQACSQYATTTTQPNTAYIYNTLPILSRKETKLLKYKRLYCQLFRVFNNGNFEEGGRFYGAEYQMMNEEERSKILINENETIEIDYKALHPRMIYHLEGIDYKDDPYLAVSNVPELRKPIKKYLQIIINTKNYYASIETFRKLMKEEPEYRTSLDNQGIDDNDLYELIIKKHKRIENYFNSRKGVQLQYRDSKIAEAIMRHFTLQGIVCLCVHDSFIVERKYENELEQVMKEKYKNEIGFEPQLKKTKKGE